MQYDKINTTLYIYKSWCTKGNNSASNKYETLVYLDSTNQLTNTLC